MMRRAAPFLIAALILAAVPAHAQFDSIGNDLSITLSPANPRPYQTITVTPSSNLIDLAASTVTVSVNGKVVVRGSGVQSVPITVGGPGVRTTIDLSAVYAGKTYSSSVSFRPSDVSLVVEPITSTHPFYLGAPLVASEGRVRIIALADLRTAPGTRLNPSGLTYTWKLGDQVLQSESGIGHSMLVAVAPVRYRDAQVSVSVSDTATGLTADAATTISPVDPVARIYHVDPLMGPDFDHALLGGYAMNGTEDAFRAVAYYFGSTPSLSWAVNGRSVSNENDVTVRATGGGAGSATLSLTAANADTRQSATAQLPVSFGGEKSSNLFGF